MSGKAGAGAGAGVEEAKKDAPPASAVPTMDVLEEDDEFLEFADTTWDPAATTSTDAAQWQDDWDDDDADDDFVRQLRAELAKTKAA